MTMITPSYLGETIEYSSLHACRSTLEDPTEIVTKRLYVAIAPLREWLVEQHLNYRELIEQLYKNKIILNKRHKLTLGAGSGIPGGQEWCIEVNLDHADMTGVTNVLQFPPQPTRSSSEGDDAPPPQSS